jgi:hypothetical protein
MGAELFHAGGRAGGRTDTQAGSHKDTTKPIYAFRNFSKAPKRRRKSVVLKMLTKIVYCCEYLKCVFILCTAVSTLCSYCVLLWVLEICVHIWPVHYEVPKMCVHIWPVHLEVPEMCSHCVLLWVPEMCVHIWPVHHEATVYLAK